MLSRLLTAVVVRWEVDVVRLESSVHPPGEARDIPSRCHWVGVERSVFPTIRDLQFVHLAIQQDLINIVTKDVEVAGSSWWWTNWQESMITAEVCAKQQGTFGINFNNLHFQLVSTSTCLKMVVLHHPEKKKACLLLASPQFSQNRSDFHCRHQLAASDFVD